MTTADADTVKLEPCPFCGGEPFVEQCSKFAWVDCTSADCDGAQGRPILAEAIAAWNTRTQTKADEVAELVEALEKAVNALVFAADDLADANWFEEADYRRTQADEFHLVIARHKAGEA